MKRSKFILFLVLCITMLNLTGCRIASDYQKSLYNDNSKIVKEADSYNYLKRVINIKGDNTNITFDRFYGMDTIWTIDADVDGTIKIDYDADIKNGSFKTVIITPNNEVNLVFENSQSGSKEFSVKKGKNRIKIIGSAARGKINFTLKLDKQMRLK